MYQKITEDRINILNNNHQKFQCLSNMLILKESTSPLVISACCCLHNFVMMETKLHRRLFDSYDTENGDVLKIPAEWRLAKASYGWELRRAHGNTDDYNAKDIRYVVSYYVNHIDPLPWQNHGNIVNFRF